MFQVMSLSRVIQVFIIFFGGGIFFLILSLFIIKKNKNRLNFTISGFFIFIFLGGLINVIYTLLTLHADEALIIHLHILTYICYCFAQIFLLLFNLLLIKSQRLFSLKKQLIIMSIYLAFLSVLFFIPEGVRINKSTFYRPQWNIYFFIYANCIWIIFAMIPSLYTGLHLYRIFEDPEIKKRWRLYIIGTIMIYIEIFAVGVLILINDPFLRLIWNIYDVLVLLAAFFIYYGVVHQV